MATSKSIRVVGALALAVVCVHAASAQEPRVVRANEKEKKIEAELSHDTSITFIDSPLTDVVAYLRDRHGIEVYLDVEGLPGEPENPKVSAAIEGISLRSALTHLLTRLNLAWTVRDEAIVITVPENTESLLVYIAPGLQNDGKLDVTLKAVFPDAEIVAHGQSLIVNARQSDHNRLLQLLRQLHAQEQGVEQDVADARTNRRNPYQNMRSIRGRNPYGNQLTNPRNPFGDSVPSTVEPEPRPEPSPFE